MSKIDLVQQNAVIKKLDASSICWTEFFSKLNCADVNGIAIDDLPLAFEIINKG